MGGEEFYLMTVHLRSGSKIDEQMGKKHQAQFVAEMIRQRLSISASEWEAGTRVQHKSHKFKLKYISGTITKVNPKSKDPVRLQETANVQWENLENFSEKDKKKLQKEINLTDLTEINNNGFGSIPVIL